MVSLAIVCKEDSFVMEIEGIGFGSKAVRFPKSKVTGIAFSGFMNLSY